MTFALETLTKNGRAPAAVQGRSVSGPRTVTTPSRHMLSKKNRVPTPLRERRRDSARDPGGPRAHRPSAGLAVATGPAKDLPFGRGRPRFGTQIVDLGDDFQRIAARNCSGGYDTPILN